MSQDSIRICQRCKFVYTNRREFACSLEYADEADKTVDVYVACQITPCDLCFWFVCYKCITELENDG